MTMIRSSGKFALLACACAAVLAGCGQKASTPAPTGTPIGAAASDAEQQAAVDAKAAELAAKEQDLAGREAALKEQELAAREAAVQAEEAALAKAKQDAEAAAAASKKAAAKPKPASTATSSKSAAAPKPIVVPAGTQLAVELAANVDTKIARLGDPVSARLASDLTVDGRRAAKAGAEVKGSIVQLVSGSHKIGGIPTLGLKFDTLVAADGSTKTINAPYVQQGKSETGKDTAKILGGAAAGAVIGHQVEDDDKGAVIGGLLGAGAGAVAAKKTGGEIKITAGTVLTVSTESSFDVTT
jgi:hypothetical protein